MLTNMDFLPYDQLQLESEKILLSRPSGILQKTDRKKILFSPCINTGSKSSTSIFKKMFLRFLSSSPNYKIQQVVLHYSKRSPDTLVLGVQRRQASAERPREGALRRVRPQRAGASGASPGAGSAAAHTHLRSGEASARPGLQLALAALALAVDELLRDLALVAAGHRPVGSQFPLAPRATLAAPGPAGREVAQVVVIQAVVELLVRAPGRPPLGRLRPAPSLCAQKGRVHVSRPRAARPRAPFRSALPAGRGLRLTSQSPKATRRPGAPARRAANREPAPPAGDGPSAEPACGPGGDAPEPLPRRRSA